MSVQTSASCQNYGVKEAESYFNVVNRLFVISISHALEARHSVLRG